MRRILEVMMDAVRNPKPPFRKPADIPKKSQKHRYERRKVKEFLHLTDWQTESAT